jgi:hypothetical protein
VVDAIKQAMGSFVSFTFSTKFVCRVNQILTVIAVIRIQNLRQAFISKSHNLMSRNVNFCAIVLYLVVYHVCFQDGKLCLLVANDKLDGK